MTPEQKAAFINSQSVMLYAEIQAAIAANKFRERQGYTIAYGEEEMQAIINKYEPTLGYNAVIGFFRD